MEGRRYYWFLLKRYFEVLVWIGAMTALAFSSLDFNDHATLCPFRSLGWRFCPGCGLGRSIILFFHGRIADSFAMHPLGMVVLAALVFRVVTLVIKNRQILRYLNQSKNNSDDTPLV